MDLVVRNLPNDPDNEVDTEIGYITVEGVDVQDAEKETEDNNDDDINYDNSRETDEADYIRNDDNQPENADGGVQTIELTKGVPQKEPAGPLDGGVLVEYVTLEETERDGTRRRGVNVNSGPNKSLTRRTNNTSSEE